MYWHIETDIVCLLIMVALLYNMVKYDVAADQQDRMFTMIAAVSIGCMIIDIAASLVMDFPINWWVYQILEILYFITVPLLILLWYLYLRTIIYPVPTKAQHLRSQIAILPYIVFVLICLSNPFTDLVFILSPDMQYTRGPLFISAYILLAFYTIISVIAICINNKRFVPRSRLYLFLLYYLVVTVGVIVQVSIPGWLVIYGAFTFIFVTTYFFLQNRRTLSDGLTGVLTRFSGEQQITDFFNLDTSNVKAALILVDLDNLKLLNDSEGHRFGDLALRCSAEACQEIFPDSIICRFGGDEFMIFVAHHGDRETVVPKLGKLNEALRKRVKANAPDKVDVAISFSIGAAFLPEDGKNFPDLYECADLALYQAKFNGRNRYMLYEHVDDERRAANAAEDSENEKGSALASPDPSAIFNKTMLVIDDSEITREILTTLFCDEFIMLRASSAEIGMHHLQRYGKSITVILLDLNLHGRSGIDFLIDKRRNPAIRNIPVIVLTVVEDKNILQKARDYGANEVTNKPIHADELRKTVKKVVSEYGDGFWYEDRYQREFLDLANTGMRGGIMCVKDQPKHPVDYISNSLLQLLGYDDRADFLSSVDGFWDNAIVPEDLPGGLLAIKQAIDSAGTYTDVKYHLKRKDGSCVRVRDNGKIVRSEDGQIFVIGLCVDIEEEH